jgi:hypothetical protein
LHSLTVGIIVLSAVSVALNVSALWRFLRIASVSLGELLRPAGRIAALTVPSLALVIIVELGVPAALLVASAAGWLIAFALAVYFSPEPRALMTGSHD